MKQSVKLTLLSSAILATFGIAMAANYLPDANVNTAAPEQSQKLSHSEQQQVVPVANEKAYLAGTTKVTVETYPVYETSRQLLKYQDEAGINKFAHRRVLTPTDNQPVVRMNRDTYYSMATVNVSKGASITMPEIPEGKYMSVMAVTEDHRIQAMKYGAGTFDLKTHTGTHLVLIIRFDSTFSQDEVHALQDAMIIEAGSDQPYQAKPINGESLENIGKQLKAKAPQMIAEMGAP